MTTCKVAAAASNMPTPILIIHGGAGNISDAAMKVKWEGMVQAIRESFHQLVPPAGSEKKGSALDAVEAAVCSMERHEIFNAGYGACLNIEGNVELDASIMEGATLRAGCVTLLKDIMQPVSVARRVMEQTNHTFLGGVSAQKFALQQGFKEVAAGSLVTPAARDALEKFKQKQAAGQDTTYARTELDVKERPGEPGTVGAVAIDSDGNIAAATSTGGITGKIPGRIGDTPLLGCGNYADNQIGGVSTTGHGETIMRFNLGQRILQKMQYTKCSPQQATEEACKEMTERLKGTGGAIVVDPQGEVGIYWTSRQMAWASARAGEEEIVYGVDRVERVRVPLVAPAKKEEAPVDKDKKKK